MLDDELRMIRPEQIGERVEREEVESRRDDDTEIDLASEVENMDRMNVRKRYALVGSRGFKCKVNHRIMPLECRRPCSSEVQNGLRTEIADEIFSGETQNSCNVEEVIEFPILKYSLHICPRMSYVLSEQIKCNSDVHSIIYCL